MKNKFIILSVLFASVASAFVFSFSGKTNNNEIVSFYQVPLVCPAATHIGCGSEAKPLLLELENHSDIAEAWLNREGIVIALVWENSSVAASREEIAQSIFQKNRMGVKEIKGKEYKLLFYEFQNKNNWLRGAEVDRLSEEEAGVIAERFINRMNVKTPLSEEKAEPLKAELSEILKANFISVSPKIDSSITDGSYWTKLKRELLEAGKKYLNETEMSALQEALSLGLRPTENESKGCCSPKNDRKKCCSKKQVN